MEISRKYVEWQDIQKYIESVAEFFKNNNITGVYGIPRGGLVLAVLLSHKMNIPLLQAPTENCIIIDDICDSGESLMHYFKNSSGNKKRNNYITTMYYKKNDLVKPDMFFKYKENEWIVYPWEVDE